MGELDKESNIEAWKLVKESYVQDLGDKSGVGAGGRGLVKQPRWIVLTRNVSFVGS